jgi:hypothetical protein
MGSRRRTKAVAARAGPARVDKTSSSALSMRAEILARTCRRHEATLEALLETVVKLHGANSALRAENASLRTRNAVSMVERVRGTPRGRPRASVRGSRDGVMSTDWCSHGH